MTVAGKLYYWIANWNLSRAQAATLLHGEVANMIDCTGSAAPGLLRAITDRGAVGALGAYLTGSEGIPWSEDEIAEAQRLGFKILKIDQSDFDHPEANVKMVAKDVEPGASTPTVAAEVAEQRLRAGEDLIIYCDQAQLPDVEDAIARKGLPAGEIIAYQYASPTSNPGSPIAGGTESLAGANADLSVILRSHLPGAKAKPEPKPEPKPEHLALVTFHGHHGMATVRMHDDGRFEIHGVHGGEWQIRREVG